MDGLSRVTTSTQENIPAGNVLVADDDDMVRLLTRQALEELNLAVEEASNGQECLTQFENARFDLILLDLEMPVMDGFETCSKLRQLPGGKDSAIIVITGLDDHSSIHRAYELGATDFITKPINWPILVQRVRYILRAQQNVVALRESEFTLSEAQRLAQLGNWNWDIVDNRFYWSDEARRILGQNTLQIHTGSFETFLEAVHPADRTAVSNAIGTALKRGDAYNIEHRVVRPDGTQSTVNSRGVVMLDGSGKPTRIRNIIQDITERKQAEEQIHQLFYYNERTGLPNRNLFLEQAARILTSAKQEESNVCFILLDLDRFQRINDSLSHSVGDQLLKCVAQRISESALQSDLATRALPQISTPFFVAHMGGDEFVIACRGNLRADEIANFTQRLLEHLCQPIDFENQEVYITASAGIAVYPEDSDNLEELLKNADVALSYSKKAGRNCFRFYASEMNHRALERLSLESQLNRALENNELEVFYQPQTELASGKTVGLEALLRWRLPDGTMVSPAEFIPLAEETGLIVPIGEWVMNAVCAQLASWQHEGYQPIQVAVNLSARQFANENLHEMIRSALRSSGIEPQLLELELTESTIMQDAEATRSTLQALKDLGVNHAVDDFGQGYSSMSYLKYFPLDTLKVDRTFIRDLNVDPHNVAIVTAIIALSQGLGLRTICEGVETDQQRIRLKQMGADIIQGFLISRPLPASQAVSFLTPDNLQNMPAA